MNQRIKTLWVAALYSGAFKQRQQYLNRGGRHCCLGVLCEVAGNKPSSTLEDTVYYGGFCSTLSPSFRDSVGLSHSEMHKLISMNDKQDLTFKQIANWIEREL